MDKVGINVNQTSAIILLIDEMGIPDLVVDCLRRRDRSWHCSKSDGLAVICLVRDSKFRGFYRPKVPMAALFLADVSHLCCTQCDWLFGTLFAEDTHSTVGSDICHQDALGTKQETGP